MGFRFTRLVHLSESICEIVAPSGCWQDSPSLQFVPDNDQERKNMAIEPNVVQEGPPDVMPVEACQPAWQDPLENLAKHVEPEINQ